MKAIAREGQCLVDIALATTGSVEGVWALALRNGLSMTGAMAPGTEIEWEAMDVIDARVVGVYGTEGVCPAAEVSERQLEWLLKEAEAKDGADWDMIDADWADEEQTRATVFTGEFTTEFS